MYGGRALRKCFKCAGSNRRRLYRTKSDYKQNRQMRARLNLYGLTPERWSALLGRQDGGCAICKKDLRDDLMTVVDHDHATGKVRGILCRTCNLGLGHLKDDAALLRAALDYLTRT